MVAVRGPRHSRLAAKAKLYPKIRQGLTAMAKRGRQPGFRMSDEHRVKIQNSNILNALIEHAVGKRKMSATQVNAGLGLLKKVLPDLSAMALTGGDGGPIQHEYSTKEQRDAAVAAALRADS